MNGEIKKGSEIILSITGLNTEGRGIGRTVDGFVVFCRDALPGDKVRASIKKKKVNYAEAGISEIIIKSSSRIEPECIHFGTCGGCKLQNYAYKGQIEFKTETVRNAFERVGGFSGLEIPEALEADKTYFYRNKTEYSFSDDKWVDKDDLGKPKVKFALGYHIPKFHSKILEIKECRLQSEISYKIVNFTREFFKSRGTSIFSSSTQEGYLRFLIIRESTNTKDKMVSLVTGNRDRKTASEYKTALLNSFPEITTVVNGITGKKAGVAFAEEFDVLHGEGYITEKLRNGNNEYSFRISPNSFFQTNTLQAEKLYSTAQDFGGFNEKDRVLDLYCGAGSIAVFISCKAGFIKGVELIEESVKSAEENAALNGIKNTEFELSDIRDFMVKHGKDGRDYNKIILDPPRAGLHPDICSVIGETNLEKIVYVSCNPVTQARDIKLICDKGNYRITGIQPVDMFPQTYHIENVVLLERH